MRVSATGTSKHRLAFSCELIVSRERLSYTFFFQNTALHIAAANGHASVVTLLLSNPISEITFNNTSDNILDVAVKEKRSTVVMGIAENDRLLSQYDYKCLINLRLHARKPSYSRNCFFTLPGRHEGINHC